MSLARREKYVEIRPGQEMSIERKNASLEISSIFLNLNGRLKEIVFKRNEQIVATHILGHSCEVELHIIYRFSDKLTIEGLDKDEWARIKGYEYYDDI